MRISGFHFDIADQRFNRLTEKFYQKAPWPEADSIAPLVNNDPHFLILYKELYYRHIYARLTPTIDHRFASYDVHPFRHQLTIELLRFVQLHSQFRGACESRVAPSLGMGYH
jgi:hypothetical protein